MARDEYDDLYVYKNKPKKFSNYWDSSLLGSDHEKIDKIMFSFIKWEDEEPYRIKDLLGEEYE